MTTYEDGIIVPDFLTTGTGYNCRMTDVSEELSAPIIRVTRIGELGTLAVTSNRRTLRRNALYFLQEPKGVTYQKTPFFIITAVKTSYLKDIIVVSSMPRPLYLRGEHPVSTGHGTRQAAGSV
jgi:hypothetical protein